MSQMGELFVEETIRDAVKTVLDEFFIELESCELYDGWGLKVPEEFRVASLADLPDKGEVPVVVYRKGDETTEELGIAGSVAFDVRFTVNGVYGERFIDAEPENIRTEIDVGTVADFKRMLERKKLRCPFCGSDKFIRYAEEEVEIRDYGETVTDVLIGGDAEYTYRCKNCGRDITEAELKR